MSLTVERSQSQANVEGLVDGLAGQDVLDLGAHEAGPLPKVTSRCWKFDNLPELAVDDHNERSSDPLVIATGYLT